MYINFNIFNISEILNQLGKNEVSNALDTLIKRDTNWHYERKSGFLSCIREFCYLYSGGECDELSVITNFMENIRDEKFYDELSDSLDVLYCISNAKSQSLIFMLMDNEHHRFHNQLLSDRFSDRLSFILKNTTFSDTNEARLFNFEISYRFKRSNFSKFLDRNFDAKDYSDEFTVTYTPKGKKTLLSDDGCKWSKQNRVSSKFVKAMKKIPLKFNYSNQFWEQLNNAVCASYDNRHTFEIVKGNDIVKYYRSETYDLSKTTSLTNSCMRHAYCSEYIQFYAENSEVVSMLIALNKSGKLVGRALLWNIDGEVYMDRIYGSEITIEAFKSYAIERGWSHKAYQSYDDELDWVNKDGEYSKKLYVDVKNIYTMPYMDTFKYTDDLSDSCMTLTNSNGDYCFNDTDGCTGAYNSDDDDDEDYVICNQTDDRIHVDDAREVNGLWYRRELCLYADDIDEYILECDAIYLAYENRYVSSNYDSVYIDCPSSFRYDEYVHSDDAIELSSGEYALSIETVQLSNGDYVLRDEAFFNEINGETILDSGEYFEVVVKHIGGGQSEFKVCTDAYDDTIGYLIEDICANLSDIDTIYVGGQVVYQPESSNQ